MKIKKEIKRVEELGEQIGYGNMMSIASALWRKKLKESGTPVSGAFVPTCLPFIKDECQDLGKGSREMYDGLVSGLKTNKTKFITPYISNS